MYQPSLSWEANGVLCWARTQPTFTLKNLLRKGTGRDRAYRILRVTWSASSAATKAAGSWSTATA